MTDRKCTRDPTMLCPIEAEDLSADEDYVCPLGEVVKVKCCTPFSRNGYFFAEAEYKAIFRLILDLSTHFTVGSDEMIRINEAVVELTSLKLRSPLDPLAQKKLDAVMKVVNTYIPFGDSPTAIMVKEIKEALEKVK